MKKNIAKFLVLVIGLGCFGRAAAESTVRSLINPAFVRELAGKTSGNVITGSIERLSESQKSSWSPLADSAYEVGLDTIKATCSLIPKEWDEKHHVKLNKNLLQKIILSFAPAIIKSTIQHCGNDSWKRDMGFDLLKTFIKEAICKNRFWLNNKSQLYRSIGWFIPLLSGINAKKFGTQKAMDIVEQSAQVFSESCLEDDIFPHLIKATKNEYLLRNGVRRAFVAEILTSVTSNFIIAQILHGKFSKFDGIKKPAGLTHGYGAIRKAFSPQHKAPVAMVEIGTQTSLRAKASAGTADINKISVAENGSSQAG
ncbi:hypothetical protein HOD08_05275 [bacterium]|nr:hypothetical protein [bacterium]